MKKLMITLIIILLASIANASINPSIWITKDTPFLGGFIDDSPSDLVDIHNDILDRLTPAPGTKPFEYKILDDGRIAGYVTPDGRNGWCSNYAAAVKARLFDSGYTWDRVEYAYCSIYDTKKPDHVVVFVDKEWIMDANKDFIMRPKDYPQRLTVEGINSDELPYIWWAKTEGQWVRAKL